MVKNIIYVQQNEEIAKSVLEGIAGSGYEVFHCVTAGEALNLMTRQDAPLLMLDINIPDQRLREVVRQCSEKFPATVLAIFTDYPNSELLTKLINRHGIYKIFVAPWDMEEIVPQIEDAMEYAEIRFEQLQREGALALESSEFDVTLANMKDSLKFQQHSYYKLNAILNTLLRVTTDCLQGDRTQEEKERLFDFSDAMLEGIIKAQTTTSLEVKTFEDTIREDLLALKHVTVKKIESCLIGDIPRVMVANIKALIRNTVYYASRGIDYCEAEVHSSYITNTRIYLEMNVSYSSSEVPMMTLRDSVELGCDRLLREMFAAMTAAEDVIRKDSHISFRLQVPISFLD